MQSPRKGAPRGRRSRRLALWAGVAVGGLLPAVGCQVEYGGMTLPSGKYLHDDVQYLAPGPDFPWANTQAATQRARMQAMGLDVPSAAPVGPVAPPRPAGALPPVQNIPNIPTNINVQGARPSVEGAEGVAPAPGVAPAGVPMPTAPGEVPAPPAPGNVPPPGTGGANVLPMGPGPGPGNIASPPGGASP